MRLTSSLSALLMATLTCTAWAQQPLSPAAKAATPLTLTTAQSQVHQEAVSAFRSQRYAAAYGRFAALADAGHAPSAEAALFMFQNGLQLFGSDWSASAPQLAHWHALLSTSRASTPTR